MNIALFAAREVGNEIAKFFGERKEPLACLVLDARETDELNEETIRNSGCAHDKVFYSDTLYTEEVLTQLCSLELDLILLAWWSYIIKEPVIEIPRIGCLNFHPSYLPYNRGKHYNFWSIIEESPFGVTLHFVDKGVDTGDIAFRRRIEKTWEDTGETLYYKAQREIVRLFKDNFDDIKRGHIPRQPQNLSEGSFHRSKELEAASEIKLDESYTARNLLNLLRARTFRPHPGAWFIDGDEHYEARVEITKVKDSEAE